MSAVSVVALLLQTFAQSTAGAFYRNAVPGRNGFAAPGGPPPGATASLITPSSFSVVVRERRSAPPNVASPEQASTTVTSSLRQPTRTEWTPGGVQRQVSPGVVHSLTSTAPRRFDVGAAAAPAPVIATRPPQPPSGSASAGASDSAGRLVESSSTSLPVVSGREAHSTPLSAQTEYGGPPRTAAVPVSLSGTSSDVRREGIASNASRRTPIVTGAGGPAPKEPPTGAGGPTASVVATTAAGAVSSATEAATPVAARRATLFPTTLATSSPLDNRVPAENRTSGDTGRGEQSPVAPLSGSSRSFLVAGAQQNFPVVVPVGGATSLEEDAAATQATSVSEPQQRPPYIRPSNDSIGPRLVPIRPAGSVCSPLYELYMREYF